MTVKVGSTVGSGSTVTVVVLVSVTSAVVVVVVVAAAVVVWDVRDVVVAAVVADAVTLPLADAPTNGASGLRTTSEPVSALRVPVATATDRPSGAEGVGLAAVESGSHIPLGPMEGTTGRAHPLIDVIAADDGGTTTGSAVTRGAAACAANVNGGPTIPTTAKPASTHHVPNSRRGRAVDR